jgi:hypothetical protein
LIDDPFAELEAFCLFIGYPRSGHSLVGSLLDAHPQMIVAHELDVLRYVEEGEPRKRVLELLLANSEAAAREGRRETGYSYVVPNQWQGAYEKLRVIGDKKGGVSTRRLRANPGLLEQLRETIGLPLKLIHVVRNPYDNISTMAIKPEMRLPVELRGKVAVPEAAERYFSLCDTVARTIEWCEPGVVFTLRYELLGDQPAEKLRELCDFLGVETSKDYLQDCVSIVRREQHRSRNDVDWPPELIADVAHRMGGYDFLEGYSFEH